MSGYTEIENKHGADIKFMGSLDLVETEAVDQALRFFDHEEVADNSEQMILNPDLHPGTDIPVGVTLDLKNHLIPRMIGRDIGCGMRLETLPVDADILQDCLPELKQLLRSIFFGGQRNLLLSPSMREGIFRYGLPALSEDLPSHGLFSELNRKEFEASLRRIHSGGSFPSEATFSLYADYIQSSASNPNELTADSQLGSLGGGNHFCEIGIVEELYEGATAREWGLLPGIVVLFTHSGSLSTGAAVGNHFTGNQHAPVLNEAEAQSFISSMNNAANFAFANRLALSLMARRAGKIFLPPLPGMPRTTLSNRLYTLNTTKLLASWRSVYQQRLSGLPFRPGPVRASEMA